jgi:hypothetical protein
LCKEISKNPFSRVNFPTLNNAKDNFRFIHSVICCMWRLKHINSDSLKMKESMNEKWVNLEFASESISDEFGMMLTIFISVCLLPFYLLFIHLSRIDF